MLASVASLVLSLAVSAAPADFDAMFTGKTLRFDYFHSGTAAEEFVSLDQVRLEGGWPGSRAHLLDDTNLGKYLFVIVDSATNQPLYSRGFASIFGEWETTGEAKKIWRTFHESLRFPEPKKIVQVVLKKRAPDGAFREFYTALVDPTSRFVSRAPLTPRGQGFAIFENGPPATKVDLLVLGEGYTTAEGNKFKSDVTRLASALFDTAPFKAHRSDFNVRAIHVPSAQSGVSNPRKGVWRDTPLGLSFNAFDSDRYVLTYANPAIRDIAAQAPYDALIILFNERKYGGGGIFNLYATCASDTEPAPYVFVHEFGHSFAGLADEYYTSQVSYEGFTPEGSEPWEPNVTALLDPKNVKWRDLVAPGAPIPTPWNQASFDRASLEYQDKRQKMVEEQAPEDAMEALFREVKEVTTPMLREEKFFGKVGAFEGAGYQAKGLYRPEADCIMFTRNPSSFCKVCTHAIERVIRLYAE